MALIIQLASFTVIQLYSHPVTQLVKGLLDFRSHFLPVPIICAGFIGLRFALSVCLARSASVCLLSLASAVTVINELERKRRLEVSLLQQRRLLLLLLLPSASPSPSPLQAQLQHLQDVYVTFVIKSSAVQQQQQHLRERQQKAAEQKAAAAAAAGRGIRTKLRNAHNSFGSQQGKREREGEKEGEREWVLSGVRCGCDSD